MYKRQGEESGDDAAADEMEIDDADNDGVPKELRGDFSGLAKDLQRTLDDGARARKLAELDKKIEATTLRLDDTVPNLKAPEEYAAVVVEFDALLAVRLCPLAAPCSALPSSFLACWSERASTHLCPRNFCSPC